MERKSECVTHTLTGVLVPSLFPHREQGNAYLTKPIETPSIFSRLETLISSSSVFVVLPGTLGTLAEIVLLWNYVSLFSLSGRTDYPLMIAFKGINISNRYNS